MSPRYLVALAVAAFLSAPVSAQSVKAGIEAWQRADYAAAVAIWTPLAENGDADAQFNLGQAYRLGKGVPINLGSAKSWFQRAAVHGHLDAETTLGLLLFQNGYQAEGLKWLKQAAEQNEPRAQLVYGTALYNGDGVTEDKMLGYAYVSRAAAQGLVPARQTLADLDQLMSPADRKKALARTKVKSAPEPKSSKTLRMAQSAPPAPKPAKTVAARPAAAAPATGAWRIQLGAFSQRGAAEALYQRVAGKPALAGRSPFYISVGSMPRLQVGPFASRASAQSACGTLGTACFPVPAK